MNRRSWSGATAGIMLVATSGCGLDVTSSDDDDASGEEPSSSADSSPNGAEGTPPRSEQPSDGTTGSGPSAGCPVGTWRLRDLRATGDADVARVEFSGGGSLTIAFASDGTWTLTDDASEPLHASLDEGGTRFDGQAAIDGTASGTYTDVGNAYIFDLESSRGEARISGPGYNDTVDMSEVVAAFVPTEQATLDCDGDTLRLDSETVTMTLSLLGPERSDASAQPDGGSTIQSSGTRDCDNRPVTIDAELEEVVLTGECEVVEVVSDNTDLTAESVQELVVSGSLNEITVDAVATISIPGSSNEIFWAAAIGAAEPTSQDDGPFNTVQQR
jgi:Protein of unknown function (DUF3060)